MKILDKFDVQLLAVKDTWVIADFALVLTNVEMHSNGYFHVDNAEAIFEKIYDKYWTYLVRLLLAGKAKYQTQIRYDGELNEYAQEGYDINRSIREYNTYIRQDHLFDAIKADNLIGIDLEGVRKYLSGEDVPDMATVVHMPQVEVVTERVRAVKKEVGQGCQETSASEMAPADLQDESKYPDFKGIKFEDLTKEQFAELKQYYGIVKNEESKLRRAIPIAAKIGLLFHERGLEKPTTRSAFLDAYKQEFDAILKNDVLAKDIYRSLPPEYRGGRSTPENSGNILHIIRAAVYAGSIYDTEDVKDLDTLKAELFDHEYRVPSDDILTQIIEATKQV